MLQRPPWPASWQDLIARNHGKDRGELLAAYASKRAERSAELTREIAQKTAQQRAELCRRLSEIGSRFAERTLETFRVDAGNRTAFELAKSIATDPTRGGYFFGDPGNGKSHLAGGIVNALTASGTMAVFTTAVGLLMRIRDTYTRKGVVREGELDIIRHLANVRVLVLDDLGTEPFTADTARLFYALLNWRYENNLPLIVTSNRSLADLRLWWKQSEVDEMTGLKIIDRIREMCGQFVRIEGTSRRGSAA